MSQAKQKKCFSFKTTTKKYIKVAKKKSTNVDSKPLTPRRGMRERKKIIKYKKHTEKKKIQAFSVMKITFAP